MKKSIYQTSWAANLRKRRKCGRLRVKIRIEHNEVDEEITIVQEPLKPSQIIDCNTGRLLRNDVEYPRCLKINKLSTDISTLPRVISKIYGCHECRNRKIGATEGGVK